MRSTTIGQAPHAVAVTIFPEPVALGEFLARDILAGIATARLAGRDYLLGCPGGRSAMTTYQALGRLVAETGADLSRLVIMMMDEYLFPAGDSFVYCPPEAHYSCHRFAEREIVETINAGIDPSRRIPRASIRFPDPADPASYDVAIAAAGGIDLFIIASGTSDGHVAFNPPGTPADAPSRIIPLAETTRSDNMKTFPEFTDLREVPSYGVSVGLGTISQHARAVVLIAQGAEKAPAVRRLATAGDFDPAWPASIIYRCPNARVLLDEMAAGAF